MDKAPPGINQRGANNNPGDNPHGTRLLQRFVYLIIFSVLLIFIISYPGPSAGWRYYGSVIALAALLALNIAGINPNPAASPRLQAAHDWAFLTISTALILATAWMSGQVSLVYLIDIVTAQACYKKGVWPVGVAFGAAILVVLVTAQIALGATFWVVVAMIFPVAVGIVFVLGVMTLLERYERQTRRAESLLRQLQAAQAALEAAHRQEKDLAIAEERVRLARDIHDGLGHHLTVLSIQLQAADKLVARNPQAAAEALQACRVEAQAALEEVRHSVSVMRQSPVEGQPLPEVLASLVNGFSLRSGCMASFDLTGQPVELPLPARETLYRAVQEGLTNVQKHAGDAGHVSVTLAYDRQAVRLTVRDEGQPSSPSPAPTGGFGLAGLRERTEQIGGTFHSGAGQAGGFEIQLSIPMPGGTP